MSNNKETRFPPPGSDQRRRLMFFGVVLLPLLAMWLVPLLFPARTDSVPFSLFLEQVDRGNVAGVRVQGETISGTFREEVQWEDDTGATWSALEFQTFLPSTVDVEFLETLTQRNVRVTTLPSRDNTGLTILLNLLPLMLVLVILFRVGRSMQGGGGMQGMFQMGANKARRFEKTESSTMFRDVAGSESAKQELEEIVDFLREPEKFREIGAETPRGVLLVGPPGTGKTLLARAVAGEAGVPFFSISGSDFVEMFVGVGASRVRNLFEEARRNSPAIVFVDELDSIGRRRGTGLGGGHDEREQTLNQLLSEMDGFEKSVSVIVLAATNRPDVLDPALLRPGRFDRRVTVPAPAVLDREAILRVHAEKRPMAEDVDLATIARSTPGFSGADLANLLNEAALVAARSEKKVVSHQDILVARDKIVLGLKRGGVVMTEEERRTVAFHEAGHALVAAMAPTAEPVHKITIVPRERAMGLTEQLPQGDRYLFREDYILDRLRVLMGGRAAEQLRIGSITSGAEQDLKQAHQLARRMVLDWGMSRQFANMAYGSDQGEVFLGEEIGRRREYSDSTARDVDDAVREILAASYDDALRILSDNAAALDALAEALLEKEEINRQEVEEICGLS
ncbi:MAG: ATP-dependent metallopeptidase FtsH/Yme1/Tma family protein [Spirochaetaceae bacterium]|nr:MAG: ATP-dependent metallopeptidase FtsH/Yme1/Tma family protein [Spirochaetaceae bacterium]